MKFKSLILAHVVIIISAGAAFAGEKKNDGLGTLKGKIYLNYNIALSADEKVHGFDLERVYFTYQKNFGEKLSTRVTMDVFGAEYAEADTDTDGTSIDTASTKSRGLFFVKYAYLQYKDKVAGIKTKFQVGQIGNPILGLADKMGGMRWITKNQMDSAKLNNSADLGAKLGLDFGIAAITTAYMNGEGYKHIGGDENSGKSSDTVLTIKPIGKELLINGYFKYAKDVSASQEVQFGGGVAWMSKMYKAGFNFIYDNENKNSYLDSWVNVNFKDLAGMPLLVLARFQMILPDTGDNTMSFLVGPGCTLNKMVQVAIIFDYSKTGDADADYNMSIQSEFKF